MSLPLPSASDWDHAALLTIDVQNDFVLPGPGCVSGTAERIPSISRLTSLFRTSGKPIVHAIRLYEPDGSNAEPFRAPFIQQHGSLVAPGSEGAELVSSVGPSSSYRLDAPSLYAGDLQQIGPSEWVMYKSRWDAFYRTKLEEHLRALDVTTLVVCGCNLPNCPRGTIFGASARDFRTVLASDAVSQVTQERLSDLLLIGAAVLDVDQIASYLPKAS